MHQLLENNPSQERPCGPTTRHAPRPLGCRAFRERVAASFFGLKQRRKLGQTVEVVEDL